jgi:hypothetical protein
MGEHGFIATLQHKSVNEKHLYCSLMVPLMRADSLNKWRVVVYPPNGG